MGYQSSSSSEHLILESISKGKSDEDGPTLGSYSAWLMKHPSALDSYEGMMKPVKGKSLVVFLDYDGTLSPIVDDPDKAFMSEKMRSAVEEVARVFPTAIISGRCRDKVKRFVQLENVIYAGSHGMDIFTTIGSFKCNNQHRFRAVENEGDGVIYFQPAKAFLPEIQEILKVLKEKTKTIKGAMVEDNKFCISVHYRLVNVEDVDTLKEMVKSIMEDYPSFRITGGKKVMEIRPQIDWDKGRALQYLIQNLGFDDCNDFLPLYIGDDKTDEDAFKAIKDIGRGYPIVVSSIPKETKASYSLRDTDEVMSFLLNLVKWKSSSASDN
ncbi:probable trehalose-phosphate phosphatase D [Ricinus communis]|uniref:Trehalose 6-phosphate phosphatase n=1 Tax=Ricinus communis TaxID=3988 RepID=B9SBJ4_RICCO|nr:probable trehalose-phosphate phosphatase D [Ricinus communis]XP_025013872.1 probable trehalose-phosphate phosphatase D [Ricinus communis]EEF39079.1 trehalose-6-phosphate synthase, putative [Ricinus communis]|eukprot:XP_002523363.1 probable trehalose-phosphate phosphatase D [Ricinus communis]